MRNRYEQLKQLNTELVTVSNDSIALLRKYTTKTKTPFPMLSDERSEVIRKYGLKNNWEPFHRGVPHPATYIIDRQGIVSFSDVRQNYLLRTKVSTIFAELKKLSGLDSVG